ncbi:MAG: alpha/beta hydrolase [Alphaproteobacteria bacterium]|nr:alpha/beta hydrolase [Alphaproteobacteria bacterium]
MESAEHWVTHGDARLKVRVVGKWGERDVVMLPSLGRGSPDFDALATRVAVQGYRVLLPEPRGIGGSSGPLDGKTLHDFAGDVAAVIRELSNGPVVLIGHAYGNRVARTVAADHPQLVQDLVLIAAGGLIPIREEIVAAMRGSMAPGLSREERLSHLSTAFFARGNDPSVWLDGWWPEVALAQSMAVRATKVEDWWEAGGKAITILQASDDAIATRENADDLARRLGDRVRIVDITGAGHAMLPEQPEQIAVAVLRVVRGAP